MSQSELTIFLQKLVDRQIGELLDVKIYYQVINGKHGSLLLIMKSMLRVMN